jgi:hypothetical protein
MALDAGPNADRNVGALAREVRRTRRDLHMLENRLETPGPADRRFRARPVVLAGPS